MHSVEEKQPRRKMRFSKRNCFLHELTVRCVHCIFCSQSRGLGTRRRSRQAPPRVRARQRLAGPGVEQARDRVDRARLALAPRRRAARAEGREPLGAVPHLGLHHAQPPEREVQGTLARSSCSCEREVQSTLARVLVSGKCKVRSLVFL